MDELFGCDEVVIAAQLGAADEAAVESKEEALVAPRAPAAAARVETAVVVHDPKPSAAAVTACVPFSGMPCAELPPYSFKTAIGVTREQAAVMDLEAQAADIIPLKPTEPAKEVVDMIPADINYFLARKMGAPWFEHVREHNIDCATSSQAAARKRALRDAANAAVRKRRMTAPGAHAAGGASAAAGDAPPVTGSTELDTTHSISEAKGVLAASGKDKVFTNCLDVSSRNVRSIVMQLPAMLVRTTNLGYGNWKFTAPERMEHSEEHLAKAKVSCGFHMSPQPYSVFEGGEEMYRVVHRAMEKLKRVRRAIYTRAVINGANRYVADTVEGMMAGRAAAATAHRDAQMALYNRLLASGSMTPDSFKSEKYALDLQYAEATKKPTIDEVTDAFMDAHARDLLIPTPGDPTYGTTETHWLKVVAKLFSEIPDDMRPLHRSGVINYPTAEIKRCCAVNDLRWSPPEIVQLAEGPRDPAWMEFKMPTPYYASAQIELKIVTADDPHRSMRVEAVFRKIIPLMRPVIRLLGPSRALKAEMPRFAGAQHIAPAALEARKMLALAAPAAAGGALLIKYDKAASALDDLSSEQIDEILRRGREDEDEGETEARVAAVTKIEKKWKKAPVARARGAAAAGAAAPAGPAE